MGMKRTKLWLYQGAGGRVPKELRTFFAGVEELILNADSFGRPYLTPSEQGKLRSHLKIMATRGLAPLKLRSAVVPITNVDDIFRLKVEKKTHNPRFYFTDVFDNYFVFLHALKKDYQQVKQRDIDKAQSRLDELISRGGPS